MADGSVIGQTTVVRGNVRGEGSLEIYGRVEGDVAVSGDVIVGDGGIVRGSISGARLSISGSVQGDLSGSLSVSLGSNAEVNGDISTPRIGIEEGAQVNGAVRTSGGGMARAAEPRRAAARPVETPRAEPAPKRAAPPSAPAVKKMPPAPVVPALRRGLAKKKSRRA
jgi:cytoskeletal protein CcmA (bactofilin family)